jgi:predicted nucleic acid-binding protein
MHLVDTSVWVEALRSSGSQKVREELEPLIRSGDVAITEWIILELMVGIRSYESSASLLKRLSPIHRLPIREDGWVRAWNLAALLRKKAVSPSVPDCLIAMIAIWHGATLVHCDGDFELIAKHERDLRSVDWTHLL